MGNETKLSIKGEYITLGQLLKFVGLVGQGGEAKRYLRDHQVFVNGLLEKRRGRKIRNGDHVSWENGGVEIVS